MPQNVFLSTDSAKVFYLSYLIAKYSQKETPEYVQETYRAEGQWITIGGVPDPKTGARHKGGTPVKVDSHGRIIAGPDQLEGKSLASLSSGGFSSRPVILPKTSSRKLDTPGQRIFWETEKLFGPQKKLGFSEPEEPHREARHPIPPGPRRLPDGRLVGHALVTVNELAADPDRFQYKTEDIDPATGTTAELKEIQVYRPEFGGQLLVWRDPETGTNYVVNGHHRFELAKRSKYWGPIAVYFIDAKNASEARAIGALANIAEGRGTALDAAKFMRESGLGPEDLKKQGISLRGHLAAKASVLRHLTPKLFQELALGRLSEAQALAIGTHLWDEPDLQEQLFHDMQKRGRFSVEELEEVAREMRSLSKASQQQTLFGQEETKRSYIWEKAYLRAHVKRRLGEQLRAFSTVTQKGKAAVLEEAGNVIAHQTNIRRKQQLEEALWMFEIQAGTRSEVSQILNQYAEAIFNNPKAKRSLAEEAFEVILEKLGLPKGYPTAELSGPSFL